MQCDVSRITSIPHESPCSSPRQIGGNNVQTAIGNKLSCKPCCLLLDACAGSLRLTIGKRSVSL